MDNSFVIFSTTVTFAIEMSLYPGLAALREQYAHEYGLTGFAVPTSGAVGTVANSSAHAVVTAQNGPTVTVNAATPPPMSPPFERDEEGEREHEETENGEDERKEEEEENNDRERNGGGGGNVESE